MMNKNSKIYIAGHQGLVGISLIKKLKELGYSNIITRSKDELNLIHQDSVKKFFEEEKPEYVFLCASRVGSLYSATTYRAEFLYENMMIEYNVIHFSFENDVKKLIFFSSADIYSRKLKDPFVEEHLTTGEVDFDAESFVLAKIGGIKMCESYNSQYGTDFITIIAANLYGKKQSYAQLNSTVVPALIKRVHEAKENNLEKVTIWGSGKAIRNFIYVDDLAESSIFLMNNNCGSYLYNVAYPEDVSIKELAYIIKEVIQYEGILEFDEDKPEGISSKRLDIAKLTKLGFTPKISIREGVKKAYTYFLNEMITKAIKLKQVKCIGLTPKDENVYSEIKENSKKTCSQPDNYKNIVVLKPWGYEFLVYENSSVAVWFLYIKNNFSTSMHCHPNKKTSLVVLDGNAYSNTFAERTYLDSNEALIINKGVFHSTKSLSRDGLLMMEIETPPDKTDLVRLRDRYGRQNNGYEGTSEMVYANLDAYGYFDFFNENIHKEHILKNKILTSEIYDNTTIANFKTYDNEMIVSFQGDLIDGATQQTLMEVGDVQYGYKFFSEQNFKIINSQEWHILRIKDHS
jgi:GDP-L-fucose synthase